MSSRALAGCWLASTANFSLLAALMSSYYFLLIVSAVLGVICIDFLERAKSRHIFLISIAVSAVAGGACSTFWTSDGLALAGWVVLFPVALAICVLCFALFKSEAK